MRTQAGSELCTLSFTAAFCQRHQRVNAIREVYTKKQGTKNKSKSRTDILFVLLQGVLIIVLMYLELIQQTEGYR